MGTKIAVALVAAALGAGLVSGVAEAAPARTAVPDGVRDSVDYLVGTYGVTEQEALRRLDLQRSAVALDGALRGSTAYGGMYLDQEAGGVLVVQATKTAAVEPFLARLPDRAHVRTKVVRNSLASLRATEARISAQVGAGPDAVYLPAVSERDNKVVVWERGWVKQTSLTAGAEDAKARAAVAAQPDVEVRPLALPTPYSTPNVDWGYCHPLYCTQHGPWRGGLRLDVQRDNGTWGGCTSGFNLRSSGGGFPGKAWVLTAGHCVVGKTNNTPIRHNGVGVVNQHGIEKNAYPYDYAALGYLTQADENSWLNSQTGHNRVLKYCRNGGTDSNADTPCGAQATSTDELITGIHPLADVKAGWVVCASGSGSNATNYPDSVDSGSGVGYLPGTRCGRVLSTDVGINTDLCARPGDSGSPLFSQVDHTALGILEGSLQSRGGACWAGEQNNYVPIDTILEELDARIAGQGSTFTVITTATG
ncbi:hypothetical protein [Actinosynnema sp. NPDC020468]|uniref:hypothetical protein n=1 Tax=Actinosynnema sp. NPDC020468 TaxID=3154488 RepID=UPI0033DFAECB